MCNRIATRRTLWWIFVIMPYALIYLRIVLLVGAGNDRVEQEHVIPSSPEEYALHSAFLDECEGYIDQTKETRRELADLLDAMKRPGTLRSRYAYCLRARCPKLLDARGIILYAFRNPDDGRLSDMLRTFFVFRPSAVEHLRPKNSNGAEEPASPE